jgi:NAD(P)-dependent dehydrogenase (short-subunit alcohol dehydrogenase family)
LGKLDGKIAVITGGNSGIGLATAQAFVDEGARVVITGRDQATLDSAAAQVGAALALVVDVGSMDDLDMLARRVQADFGGVDVLFVNAGLVKMGPIGMVSEADFDTVMDVNFKGGFFTIQKLLPLMRDGGSIILNGSVNAYVGFGGMSVYSASKAALHSLARTLSTELIARNIRVNTLTIGPVNTPLWGAKSAMSQEMLDGFAPMLMDKMAIKRFGEAHEIAKAAVFLASDDSSFVVGSEITTDGGIMLNMPG